MTQIHLMGRQDVPAWIEQMRLFARGDITFDQLQAFADET